MELLLPLIENYGLWLVFANVLALQLGLPVPAYPTLIVMGALSARGGAGVPAVLAVALAASLVADLVWYASGARHGGRALRLMCRVSLSPDSCVQQSERIYERWGAPSLMVAKFIPGFAAVATSMAGLVRTPLARFVAFDAVGALLWSGVAVGLGRAFSGQVDEALRALERAGRWGLLGLLCALALFIAVRALQRHRLIRMLRMARLDVDELYAMLERDERPLIIDVRSSSSHREGRIPGAIWVDSQAFDRSLGERGLHARMADEVIVYCACPNEASAVKVARALKDAGFHRVRPLTGGIDAWIAAGHEVER
jgi:membrane protein DedA with SNARE-associated domain/rhodanese-related sulfurtransferase